jgi:hypothetical protein
VKFESQQAWSLLPRKFVPDVARAREYRDLLRNGFAHRRAERQPEFCVPWAGGASLGWRVVSPVDVDLHPLPQHEIPKEADAEAAARAMGGQTQVWVRANAAIATQGAAWLNGYQYDDAGSTETMFIPNGQGTVEWRQGWSVTECDGWGLLVIPSPAATKLGVEIGLFNPTTLTHLEQKGLSIAIKPHEPISINRGSEIARLIPIAPGATDL